MNSPHWQKREREIEAPQIINEYRPTGTGNQEWYDGRDHYTNEGPSSLRVSLGDEKFI